jgi:type I restriction enzyme, S subunit
MTAGRIATATADADHDVPEGWSLPRVGDILSVSYGKGLPEKQRLPGKIPVYGSNGVIGYHSKPLTRGPTIVVGRKGTVGAVHFSQESCWPIDTTYFIEQFNGLEPGYVYHSLRYLNLAELDTSTAIPGLNRDELYDQRLPLAPLAEQKRIVAKIEELLARVNATRERLAKVPAILKRFRQAVLAAACSGRLTEDWRKGRDLMNGEGSPLERISSTKSEPTVADEETPIAMPQIPENWAWSHCEQLCDPKRSITYGVIKLGPPVSDGVPTLRSSDVRWLYIDDTDIKRISSKIAANFSRTFLKGGEVLVTVRGTLGGAAAVAPTMAGFNISREVAMLPLLSQLKSEFIAYAIASPWCQNWLSEVTKGVAYTGVNIRDLKRLPLPMPPVEEQEEIVRRVKTLLSLADKIDSRLKTATAINDQLTESALNKALHGELVPTEAELACREGRPYEPASELLARVKALSSSSKSRLFQRRQNHAYGID